MDKPALVYEPIEKPSRGNSTCAWILVFTPFWVHEVLRHTETDETETETETETGQLLRQSLHISSSFSLLLRRKQTQGELASAHQHLAVVALVESKDVLE